MAAHLIADKRRMSHAYILSAPGREEGLSMARQLAAEALCSSEGPRACGVCRDCRKVMQGIHPDVVTVSRLTDDKGKEKQIIAVEQIRQLVADSHTLPNEARRKVYVIDQAECMNGEAQNAALKLLEEPPPRLILALCTSNVHSLFATVRSRCTELGSAGQAVAADGENLKLAMEYIGCCAEGDAWKLCSFCFSKEGMDGGSVRLFVQAIEQCACDILCGRRENPGIGQARLMQLCTLSRRCQDYLKLNTGTKHIFGLLAVLPFARQE